MDAAAVAAAAAATFVESLISLQVLKRLLSLLVQVVKLTLSNTLLAALRNIKIQKLHLV